MDLILIKGTMHTINGETAEAMAVDKGKIAAVGSYDKIMKHADEKTVVIDLEGKTVLPGFNDSHLHFINYGLMKNQVRLEGLISVTDLIAEGRLHLKNHSLAPGEWLEGWGWNQNHFSDPAFPTKADLDCISKDVPIMFTRICCHMAVVNSKALEMAGIKGDSVFSGGRVDWGKGLVYESALDVFSAIVPSPSRERVKQAIEASCRDALAQGLTSIQSSDFHGLDFELVMGVYRELASSGRLPIRVNAQLYLPNIEMLRKFLDLGYRTGQGDEYFRLGPVKLLLDGSLGAGTAALRLPYLGDENNRGMLTYTQEELDELVYEAHLAGMQLSLHAIGDRTLDSALEALEKSIEIERLQTGQVREHRHRINHCQIADELQMERMAALGIMADIQPAFVGSDWAMVEGRIGEDRGRTSYAWKLLKKHGVALAGGSDCPIEAMSPLQGIYAAVTRKDLTGAPEGGWHPEERLTVKEAIDLFTSGSAYATFEEGVKGSLCPGMLADFVVLSEDPFDVAPQCIKNISVEAVYVGGVLKHKEGHVVF